MKQFSAPGSKTTCIPLENFENVRGREEAGGVEVQPGARGGGKEAEDEEDTKWADGE